MNINILDTRKIKELLLVASFLLVFPLVASSQEVVKEEQEGVALVDRFAVRTNVLDWALTIPNIGVEFDLNASEFNDMTVGLSAKYNWNTVHRHDLSANYAPPTVFNFMDIRPEFRYYFRTSEKGTFGSRKSFEKFLKERKSPKSWRANYLGAYINYSTYTFKFGPKGHQGQALGLGASLGYSIPMYEYKKGAVDVELGLSVGVQLADHDVFVHNPDGYYYSKVEGGREKMGFTPFPVVSDLRVAFVWRHKSIKDKVKIDEQHLVIKAHYNKIVGDYNYNDYTKESYDETLVNTMTDRQRREVMANDSLYRAGYIKEIDSQKEILYNNLTQAFPDGFKKDDRSCAIVKDYETKLQNIIEKGWKKALSSFELKWKADKADAKREALKKEKEKEAAAKKAEAQKAKEEKLKVKDGKDGQGASEAKQAKEPKEKKVKSEK